MAGALPLGPGNQSGIFEINHVAPVVMALPRPKRRAGAMPPTTVSNSLSVIAVAA
jgi:hypothetical protein